MSNRPRKPPKSMAHTCSMSSRTRRCRSAELSTRPRAWALGCACNSARTTGSKSRRPHVPGATCLTQCRSIACQGTSSVGWQRPPKTAICHPDRRQHSTTGPLSLRFSSSKRQRGIGVVSNSPPAPPTATAGAAAVEAARCGVDKSRVLVSFGVAPTAPAYRTLTSARAAVRCRFVRAMPMWRPWTRDCLSAAHRFVYSPSIHLCVHICPFTLLS